MSTIITPITMPFASGRTSGMFRNVIPAIEPNPIFDDVANQKTGFPVLQATALDAGGSPVQEGEMNGVLNFYTNLLFQMGQGYQFTFDAALVAAIGGYPQGAILWCASNRTFQISLQNNNTANFVTTPSYVNDGVNWQNLASAGEFPDITDNATTGAVTIGGRVINGIARLRTRDTNQFLALITTEAPGESARGLTCVLNPDNTFNTGLSYEKNKRPFSVAPFLSNLSVTNDSVAFVKDLPICQTFGNLLINKIPYLTEPNTAVKYIVIISGLYTFTITGGQAVLPPINFSSIGIDGAFTDTYGIISVFANGLYYFSGQVQVVQAVDQIQFSLLNNLPDGNYASQIFVSFLAN